MSKRKPATFGQDLMRGEHQLGDNAAKQVQHVSGVLMSSDSGNDPAYYFKKQEAEKRLGRELTTEEFQRDHYQGPDTYTSGTSIFDPVLCELAYSWFCPQGGTILDPFAGGSVRGIVASRLGRQYIGVELRPEQVEANRAQGDDLCQDLPPVWHTGDSRNIDRICADVDADFVFSCPPYADLEVYSDNPDDLSTLKYEDFKLAYFEIIAKACGRLKQDRFACFVVGDVRAVAFGGDGINHRALVAVACRLGLGLVAGLVFGADAFGSKAANGRERNRVLEAKCLVRCLRHGVVLPFLAPSLQELSH